MTSAHGVDTYRRTMASARQRLQSGERADGAVASVRHVPFADAGVLSYRILEADRRVDVLMITWAG